MLCNRWQTCTCRKQSPSTFDARKQTFFDSVSDTNKMSEIKFVNVGLLYFLKFAEKASGIVRVMVNGTRMQSGKPISAYSNKRYLPFLNQILIYHFFYLKIVNVPDLSPCLEASTTYYNSCLSRLTRLPTYVLSRCSNFCFQLFPDKY